MDELRYLHHWHRNQCDPECKQHDADGSQSIVLARAPAVAMGRHQAEHEPEAPESGQPPDFGDERDQGNQSGGAGAQPLIGETDNHEGGNGSQRGRDRRWLRG